jgi:hypothetical protein
VPWRASSVVYCRLQTSIRVVDESWTFAACSCSWLRRRAPRANPRKCIECGGGQKQAQSPCGLEVERDIAFEVATSPLVTLDQSSTRWRTTRLAIPPNRLVPSSPSVFSLFFSRLAHPQVPHFTSSLSAQSISLTLHILPQYRRCCSDDSPPRLPAYQLARCPLFTTSHLLFLPAPLWLFFSTTILERHVSPLSLN